MAAHKVPAEATVDRECALQIDLAFCAKHTEIRAPQCLRHDICRKRLRGERDDSETDAVDRDAVACRETFEHRLSGDGELMLFGKVEKRAALLNEAGEHNQRSPSMRTSAPKERMCRFLRENASGGHGTPVPPSAEGAFFPPKSFGAI